MNKLPDSKNMRESIFRAEAVMMGLPQVDIEVRHLFAPGVYTREMFVPAGVMLTGKVHKTEHISIMLTGRMIVPDGNGGSIEIEAPIVERAFPGVKRIGFAVEDVRWITIHPTDETDIDTLEALLVTNDPVEAECLADQHDYKMVFEELGLDALIPEILTIEWQAGETEGVVIKDSLRHGKGVFVEDFVSAGDIIAPAIKNGVMMDYSRYANHSMNPNARCLDKDGDTYLMALRDIENEEVTVNYRDTVKRIEQ